MLGVASVLRGLLQPGLPGGGTRRWLLDLPHPPHA